MIGFTRTIKCAAAVFVAAAMLIVATLPSQADTGAVRFRVGSAGFIVGVGGGSGILTFHGKSLPAAHWRRQHRHDRREQCRPCGPRAKSAQALGYRRHIHGGGRRPRHCRRCDGCPAAECEWCRARGERHPGRIFGVDRPQRIADIDAIERRRSSRLERESIGSVTFLAPARTMPGPTSPRALASNPVSFASPRLHEMTIV